MITCMYPKIEEQKFQELQENPNQVYEISQPVKINELFSINFYDSSKIDLEFNFKSCYLELSNLLMRFSKLKCKSINIFVDQLKYENKFSFDISKPPTPFMAEMNDTIAPFL